MNITDFIAKLQEELAKHGDVEVKIAAQYHGNYWAGNDVDDISFDEKSQTLEIVSYEKM